MVPLPEQHSNGIIHYAQGFPVRLMALVMQGGYLLKHFSEIVLTNVVAK